MKVSGCKTWIAAVVIALLSAPAYALSLTDPGVVGAASGESAPNASPSEELVVAQQLLNMLANSVDPTSCSLAGTTVCYRTGPTEYSATLTGGTKVEGGLTNAAGFEWVLGKYNGPNAGYVLFHIPTWGSSIIPQTSSAIWLNKGGAGYGLSHFIGWGSTRVPDSGTTLSLLGLALAGIGAFRRFV